MAETRTDNWLAEKAELLHEYLSGRDHPAPAWLVCLDLHIPERKLREVANYARKHGHADIASGNYGYSVAKTPEELRRSAVRLRTHLFSEMEVMRAMERRYVDMTGTPLFEEAGA